MEYLELSAGLLSIRVTTARHLPPLSPTKAQSEGKITDRYPNTAESAVLQPTPGPRLSK